jgi:hypothetical protein
VDDSEKTIIGRSLKHSHKVSGSNELCGKDFGVSSGDHLEFGGHFV